MQASDLLQLLGESLMLLGAIFMLIGAIGIHRMPDFFSRLHPAGIKDSFGLPLVLLGLVMQLGANLASAKLLILLLVVLLTSPVACHALARAALAMKEDGKNHDG